MQRWCSDAHPVAVNGGRGAVNCLHPFSDANAQQADQKVLFGTQEGVVAALEVYPTATSSSSSIIPMLELNAPVRCLARSPDGSRIAAATECVPSISSLAPRHTSLLKFEQIRSDLPRECR